MDITIGSKVKVTTSGEGFTGLDAGTVGYLAGATEVIFADRVVDDLFDYEFEVVEGDEAEVLTQEQLDEKHEAALSAAKAQQKAAEEAKARERVERDATVTDATPMGWTRLFIDAPVALNKRGEKSKALSHLKGMRGRVADFYKSCSGHEIIFITWDNGVISDSDGNTVGVSQLKFFPPAPQPKAEAATETTTKECVTA